MNDCVLNFCVETEFLLSKVGSFNLKSTHAPCIIYQSNFLSMEPKFSPENYCMNKKRQKRMLFLCTKSAGGKTS